MFVIKNNFVQKTSRKTTCYDWHCFCT